jgi:ABC-2 type transport system permease protein
MASVGLISLPLRLAGYRERGVLKRFRAAGLPLLAIFGSQVIVFFGSSIAGGLAIALAGKLVYGTPFPELPARSVAAYVLSGMSFAAVGVFLGAILRTARAAQGAGLLLFFVMMFISGAGPPRGVLSDAMVTASNLLPLTHVILLLQDAWLGFGWDMSAAIVLTGFMLTCAALAERFFRWE